MDKTTDQLVAYTAGFSSKDMTDSVTFKATDMLFDAICCGVAGSGTPPARVATMVARKAHSDTPATVIGFGIQTSPEMAALVNTMCVRTYDYNDGYIFMGGSHASDMMSGVLAAAEVVHASGAEMLMALTLAYELIGGMVYEGHVNEIGFDQGTFINVAVALAAGKLWGLNEDQLGNAASLALVPNLPLGVSRWGELSMMKGCATAFATRNGVFSAMLAKEGFTSAPEPFEGIFGMHHITGPFELHLPVIPGGKRVIEMTHIKPIPAEMNTIGVLEHVPQYLSWSGGVDNIEHIEIEIAKGLDVHLADEPKYDPKTRETADHSFPYMLARALVDGGITLNTYTDEHIADPGIRPIMRRIEVIGTEAYRDTRDKTQPGSLPARIKLRTKDGREMEEVLMDHSGHAGRGGVSRDIFNRKLDLCSEDLTSEQRERIRDAWWNVAKAPDIAGPISSLTGFRSL